MNFNMPYLAVSPSDTQKAASYYFDIFGTGNKLHLIDMRGALKDQANIQETIDYISQFPGLNSILILLKPNESRFTPHFRYCFKELMFNLYRRSVPNICFCFTHSKGKRFLLRVDYFISIFYFKSLF